MENEMVRRSSDVVIVGGGPSGAAAGIALVKQGLSVTILEKQDSVKDKICGEFFSPESLYYLNELSLKSDYFEENPSTIKNIAVSFDGETVRTNFEKPAHGLSRVRFDSMMLQAAEENGVHIERGVEVTDIDKNNDILISARKRKTGELQQYGAQYVIGATGAKSGSELLFSQPRDKNENEPYTVAFKFHAECPEIYNTIELYFTKYGYIGIANIENGLVNVCGLIDSNVLNSMSGGIDALLGEISRDNFHFSDRLRSMKNTTPYITCSNLSFGVRRQKYNDVLLIGDTAGAIHPFCGDGNAMALKSGLLSAKFITQGMKNNRSREDTLSGFNRRWKQTFRRQIYISIFIHKVLAGDRTRHAAGILTGVYPGIIKTVFNYTREMKGCEKQ